MEADADPTVLGDLILDQMAEALIYADLTGTIRRWNKGAEAIFGFSATEAIGQNLDLIIPEHLRAAHWRGFEAAIENGSTRLHGQPTLTRALHRSGSKRYVEMSFALVVGKDDQVLGSVAVARDVTERMEHLKKTGQNDARS